VISIRRDGALVRSRYTGLFFPALSLSAVFRRPGLDFLSPPLRSFIVLRTSFFSIFSFFLFLCSYPSFFSLSSQAGRGSFRFGNFPSRMTPKITLFPPFFHGINPPRVLVSVPKLPALFFSLQRAFCWSPLLEEEYQTASRSPPHVYGHHRSPSFSLLFLIADYRPFVRRSSLLPFGPGKT